MITVARNYGGQEWLEFKIERSERGALLSSDALVWVISLDSSGEWPDWESLSEKPGGITAQVREISLGTSHVQPLNRIEEKGWIWCKKPGNNLHEQVERCSWLGMFSQQLNGMRMFLIRDVIIAPVWLKFCLTFSKIFPSEIFPKFLSS